MNSFDRIEELVTYWITKLKLNNALGYFDINKVSEDLALELLNIVFNIKLKNSNYDNYNTVGFDLIDVENKIVYQVTSRSDRQKIIDSIRKFQKSNATAPEFQHSFFIISHSRPSFKKIEQFDIKNHLGEKDKYVFDSTKSIILIADILKEVAQKPEIKSKILKVLESKVQTSVEPDKFIFINKAIIEKLTTDTRIIKPSISLDSIEKESIPKYIRSQQSKFSRIKTMLYKDELKEFYSVYFPIEVVGGNGAVFYDKNSTVQRLFSKSRFITVIGSAGSGKSTLLKHMFLSSLKEFFALPVIIELRKLNGTDKSLLDLISDELFFTKYDTNHEILREFLYQGNILFLFDGYDEIFSKNLMDKVHELEKFIDSHHENYFLISSRPETGVEGFPRFLNSYVKGLNNSEINDFIDIQVEQEETAHLIKEGVENQMTEDNHHFFSNPLLLSLYILKFHYNPELSSNQSQLYKEIFEALYYRHDSISKNDGFLRERKTGLSLNSFQVLLEHFSFLTYFQGIYHFPEPEFENIHSDLNSFCPIQTDKKKLLHDLVVSIGIIIRDSLVYLFPHRSIQEYFVARFVASSERKREIYQSKFGQHSMGSSDSMRNLWDLCKETDNVNFYRYLIIPGLRSFLDSMTAKDDKELYYKVLEKFSVNYLYHLDESEFEEQIVLAPTGKSRDMSFEGRILNYVESNIGYLLDSFLDTHLGSKSDRPLFLFITKNLSDFLMESDIESYELLKDDYDISDTEFNEVNFELDFRLNDYNISSSTLKKSGYLFNYLKEQGFINQVKLTLADLSGLTKKLEEHISSSDLKKNNFIDFIISQNKN